MSRIWTPDNRIVVPEQGILVPDRHERMRRLGKRFADLAGPIMTPNVAAAPPPSSASVMLHFNGTNGSTTIVDSSANSYTFTCQGTCALTTAQFKFGTASLQTGSGANYIQGPAISNGGPLDLYGSAACIEAWFRPTGTSGGSSWYPISSDWNSGAVTSSYSLYYSGSVVMALVTLKNSTHQDAGGVTLTGTTTVTQNAWHHVALTFDLTTLRLFLDGNLEASNSSANVGFNQTHTNFDIGALRGFAGSGYYLDGQIDDLRIWKGGAIYTSNFTPSGPLTP